MSVGSKQHFMRKNEDALRREQLIKKAKDKLNVLDSKSAPNTATVPQQLLEY